MFGLGSQVFDSNLRDPVREYVPMDDAAAELSLNGVDQGRVDGDLRAADIRDDTVEPKVVRARPPLPDRSSIAARRDAVHADGVDPPARAEPTNDDAVADGEPPGGLDLEAPRPYRHVSVGYSPAAVRHEAPRFGAFPAGLVTSSQRP